MSQDLLNEREFELINIVGAKVRANQRDLSRHMDLSLGATNMLIRRLVNKGYIRILQLNQRKVKYILTPKGFAEKMRKSVKYTVKTINSIGSIRTKIQDIIEKGDLSADEIDQLNGDLNILKDEINKGESAEEGFINLILRDMQGLSPQVAALSAGWILNKGELKDSVLVVAKEFLNPPS